MNKNTTPLLIVAIILLAIIVSFAKIKADKQLAINGGKTYMGDEWKRWNPQEKENLSEEPKPERSKPELVPPNQQEPELQPPEMEPQPQPHRQQPYRQPYGQPYRQPYGRGGCPGCR